MMKQTLVICAAAVSLSACSGMNVFKDSNSERSQSFAPAPMQPTSTNVMSAAQIKSVLTGKSWKWVGPKNSGVTLYASDGTSLVEVTGKGNTGGKWTVKDGQLCESFNPASFIPQGVALSCQKFSGAGGTYQVGQATFTVAS